MEFALVTAAAAPLRKKPNHKREMVSQLLFGEAVNILRGKGQQWVKVKGLHDGYEGWMTRNLLTLVEEHLARIACPFACTEVLHAVRLLGEQSLQIPFGASLPGFENGKGSLGALTYEYSGKKVDRFSQQPGLELLSSLTASWLNVPYMWGGRTPLGIDCSGFVQVIFKMMGIDLPRDAWQQAQEGKIIKKIKEGQAGDLVFFDDRDEIVHVGILLNSEQLIHASGKVRIDRIDKKGIINVDTEKRTHKLEAIKRIW